MATKEFSKLQKVRKLDSAYSRSADFWARQRRAVETYIDLEIALCKAEAELMEAAMSLIEEVSGEHRTVTGELEAAFPPLSESRHGDLS